MFFRVNGDIVINIIELSLITYLLMFNTAHHTKRVAVAADLLFDNNIRRKH